MNQFLADSRSAASIIVNTNINELKKMHYCAYNTFLFQTRCFELKLLTIQFKEPW